MNFIKLIYRIALVLFLFTSLAINITMFAWQAGVLALSGAYSALSTTPAVITRFKQANDKLITTNKHLTTKVAGLTQENSKLLASNKRLTTKIATNKRTVKRLSNKIVKRTIWRTGRNIAGVVPEAIPAVGVFVNVGLTVLDIKDACATMRDMKELNAQFAPDENAVDENEVNKNKVCGMKVPSISEVKAKLKSSPEDAEDDYNKLNDDWSLDLPSWEDAKKLSKGNDK